MIAGTVKRSVLAILSVAVMLTSCAFVLGAPPAMVSPGWYQREVQLEAESAADRAIMEHNLGAAEKLITQTSGYRVPQGFEAQAFWRSQPPDGPLSNHWVDIGIYFVNYQASGGGYNTYATVMFNPDLGYLAEGAIRNEHGEYYYLELPRSEPAHDATPVYGAFGPANSKLQAWFTVHGQLPMQAVSREEYLRALIHDLGGDGSIRLIRPPPPGHPARPGWKTPRCASGTAK